MTLRPLRPALLALFTAVLAACESPDSETAAPTAATGPRALVTSDGGPHIVLRHGVEAEMARGEINLLSMDSTVVTRRAIHTEGLTSDELRWGGRRVRLHSERGVVCEAIVDDIEALGRFNPDDALLNDWHDDDGNLRLDTEELRQQAWDNAPNLGAIDLVGRLSVLQGDCSGAVWAQLAEEPAPAAAPAEPASPELRARALAAVRATDDYRQTQQRYEEYRADAPDEQNARGFPDRWEDYDGATTVSLIAHPGGETFVVTSLSAGEGCGDFLGTHTALWKLHGDVLEPVPVEGLSSERLPTGAADVDGDGHLELLLPSGYLRQTATGFDEESNVEIPANLGCGC